MTRFISALHPQLCAAVTAAALFVWPALASAKDADAEHAQRARVAYELRDWGTAAKEYRAAYEAEAKSEYLFGLAQALRQAHEYTAAVFTFKAYKRAEGVTPQQQTAAELLITECEAQNAKAEAQAALSEARAMRSAAAPAEGAAPADPAPSAPEQPQALAPAAPPAEHPAGQTRPFYTDVLGDVLFVAGAGATGVGLALLIGGNGSMRDSAKASTESSADERADSAHGKQIAGGISTSVGGALVAGALWRWLSLSSDAPVKVEQVSLGSRFISVSGEF